MRIAITGIGIISSLGIGQEANREHFLSWSGTVSAPQILPTVHKEWPIGEVPYTNQQLSIRAGVKEDCISRNILLALVALQEALKDADIHHSIPLVNGTTVGGMDLTESYYSLWKNGKKEMTHLLRQHEAAYTSDFLARFCHLQDTFTPSTACSSALNAVISGARLLRLGQSKQVVVGGTEALTRFHLNGFASLGILSNNICRPFQIDRDGINLGEGAAYLVLEDADDAVARGAHIYAYLAGYANRCDAYHPTASSPDGEGAFHAMSDAIQMAEIAPDEIEYINAHGTATVNNDDSEQAAILRLFDSSLPAIESTKPLTGHTTSASGSIEMVFSIYRMQQNGYRYALSNAFAFGGNDSSIILSASPKNLPSFKDDINAIIRESPVISVDTDVDYKPYIPVMQARRMTPILRRLVVAALQAIETAAISKEKIDAIVVATRWGGIVPTVSLLDQMIVNGEHDFSPAAFMNSTHNAVAGTLARFLHCTGYNVTIAVSHDIFEEARRHALSLIRSGEAHCVLACGFDEVQEDWQNMLSMVDVNVSDLAKATIICTD